MNNVKVVHAKYRVAAFSHGNGDVWAVISNSKEDGELLKQHPYFVGWITGRRGYSKAVRIGVETK